MQDTPKVQAMLLEVAAEQRQAAEQTRLARQLEQAARSAMLPLESVTA